MLCRLALTLLAATAASALVLSPAAAHTTVGVQNARSCLSMKAAALRTGDQVVVISGSDKGSTGKVISLDVKKNKVTVEGINMRTKHMKPMKEGETGRILKREMSVHVSNVRLSDADDDAAAEPAADAASE